MSVLSETVQKYERDGFNSLLISAPNYVLRRTGVYEYLTNKKAKRKFQLYTDQRFMVDYNGLWNGPHPAHISSRLGKASVGERFVYQFENVNIVCDPTPKLSTGWLEVKLADFNKSKLHDGMNFVINNNNKNLSSDLAVLIHSKRDRAFSHWSTEVLSQLRVIDQLPIDRDDIDIVFASPADDGLASWQRESLAMMGFEPDIILSKDSQSLFTSDVYIPSHIPLSGGGGPPYPSPNDLKWVRKTMRKNICSDTNERFKRIYVSRQNTGRRCIKNFKQIKPLLEMYDFEVINPGNLSFKEQVNIYSGANIIMGPHGGGLMNAVFADNATLIELIQDLYKNNHQFVLSNMVDISYDYVLCEDDTNSDNKLRHRDLIVDIDQLKKVLEYYLCTVD